jgi:hypothetical protein
VKINVLQIAVSCIVWPVFPTFDDVGAGIAQSVLQRAIDWTGKVRFPAGPRDLSLLHSAQTGSGAHQVSYPMDTGSCRLEGKATLV